MKNVGIDRGWRESEVQEIKKGIVENRYRWKVYRCWGEREIKQKTMRDVEDKEKERNIYRTYEERVGSKNIKRDEESKYKLKIYMAEKGVQER